MDNVSGGSACVDVGVAAVTETSCLIPSNVRMYLSVFVIATCSAGVDVYIGVTFGVTGAPYLTCPVPTARIMRA